jgi:hypothetical protein
MIGSLYANFLSGMDLTLLLPLALIGIIFLIVREGYELKILKSSLAGFVELPSFNDWFNMFIDGLRVLIVGIVYTIPLVVIIFITAMFIGYSAASSGAFNNANMLISIAIMFGIAIIYLIITRPFLLMSLANMAHNDSKIGAAFKFGEIFNKISNIGWGNFIIWYIVTGIIYLIFIGITVGIEFGFNLIHIKIVGAVLTLLFIASFMDIFLYRSAAMFYLSRNSGYLECDKCGGNYELPEGKSSEDLENCECGGKFSYKE